MAVPQPSSNPDIYQNLPFPPLPQTQAFKCSTFKIPPLDGSLSVPEIYDWHAEHSSDHPLFEFAEDDGIVQTITWKEANKGVHRAGWYTKRLLDGEQKVGGGERPIVAIFASAGVSPPIVYLSSRLMDNLIPANVRLHYLFHLPGRSRSGWLQRLLHLSSKFSRSSRSPTHQIKQLAYLCWGRGEPADSRAECAPDDGGSESEPYRQRRLEAAKVMEDAGFRGFVPSVWFSWRDGGICLFAEDGVQNG